MHKAIVIGVLGAVLACGQSSSQSSATQSSTTQPPPPAGSEQPSPALVQPQVQTQVVDAGSTILAVDATLPAPDASPPPPAVSLTPSKAWPFYAWDRAEAYTFNLRRPGPGAKLRVYNEKQGWTENPTKGPTLTAKQAKKALRLIAKTQGQMIVSKCPFPRHGIVFFQGETPVASVSVCFECGDIMVWPAYSQDPGWQAQKSRRFGKLMKSYKRVFPQWEALFESELSLNTDWTKLPTSGP